MSRSGHEEKEDEDSRLSFKEKLLKIQQISENKPKGFLVPVFKDNTRSNETAQKETEYVKPIIRENISLSHSNDIDDEDIPIHRTQNTVSSRLSSVIRNGGIRMFPPSQVQIPATYKAEVPEETEHTDQTSSTSAKKHEAQMPKQPQSLPPRAPKPSPFNNRSHFMIPSIPTVDTCFDQVTGDLHGTVDFKQLTISRTPDRAEIVPSAPPQQEEWSSNNNTPVMSPDDYLTEEELCFIYDVNDVSEIPSSQVQTLPEDGAKTALSLAQENDRLKEERLCKICLDENVAVAFNQCGHVAACEGCANQLTQCPVCRANITGRLKIYMT